MKSAKILLVEDEPIIAADLQSQLNKHGIDICDILDNGASVLNYLKSNTPDLIIIDINLLGDIDGIDIAHHLNSLNIPFIFLTSNDDTSTFTRAKITSPQAFITKPYRIKDLLFSIELALSEYTTKEDKKIEFLSDRIFIKSRNSLEKVMFNQILFLEANGAYTKIVTFKKTHILSHSIKYTDSKINVDYIIQVHRSYRVNVHNIDRLEESYLYCGDHKIPVSRTYKETLLAFFKTI